MYRLVLATALLLVAFQMLAANATPTATWKGVYETPKGVGRMELMLKHEGSRWRAVCRFPEVEDENTFAPNDLQVSDKDVAFTIEDANKNKLARFIGEIEGDEIKGTFERFIEGKSAYTGRWSLKRSN